LARALLQKSDYVLVAEEGGRLIVRPAPRELVERALREVGHRLLWTRGIYKLIEQRHHGLSWRLTLPRSFLRGARYVKIVALPDGFAVEPLSDEAGVMVEVLREWAERALGGKEGREARAEKKG
jgi:virulence-associated protein VagC